MGDSATSTMLSFIKTKDLKGGKTHTHALTHRPDPAPGQGLCRGSGQRALQRGGRRARDKNWRGGTGQVWSQFQEGLKAWGVCPVADPSQGGKEACALGTDSVTGRIVRTPQGPPSPQCQANSKTTSFLLLIPGVQPAGAPSPSTKGWLSSRSHLASGSLETE